MAGGEQLRMHIHDRNHEIKGRAFPPSRIVSVYAGARVRDLALAYIKLVFRRRFDRIFTLHTGYDALDALLLCLHRRKDELLKVLEYPHIPLHTNASENDLRTFVTKRKISGGTMSRDGRVARDTVLGLMKTCKKLGLSFWHYLGDRLGISGNVVPPLTSLVIAGA